MAKKTSKKKKRIDDLQTVLQSLDARFFNIRVDEELRTGHEWVCGLTNDDSETGVYYFRFATQAEAIECRDAIIAHCATIVGSSRVDLQACKLEYSIVSPK